MSILKTFVSSAALLAATVVGTSPSQAITTLDACALLTEGDISTAFGVSLGPPMYVAIIPGEVPDGVIINNMQECIWQTPGNYETPYLNLRWYSSPSEEDARTTFEAIKQYYNHADTPGPLALGDEGWIFGSVAAIRKGRLIVQVDIHSGNVGTITSYEQARALVPNLSKVMLKHLPY